MHSLLQERIYFWYNGTWKGKKIIIVKNEVAVPLYELVSGTMGHIRVRENEK